jgi:tetratricopeptide (TPR) repeat protein
MIATQERINLAKNHSARFSTRSSLAQTLLLQEKWAEAVPLLQEYLQWLRENKSPDPNETHSNNLALALLQTGRYPEAEKFLRELLQQHDKPGQKAVPLISLLSWRSWLGEALLLQGREREAEPLLRSALAEWQRLKDQTPRRVHRTQSALGACLTAQGRYAEAEPLLLQAFQGLEQKNELLALTLWRQTVERLITLYEKWGKPEQVARWRNKMAPAPAKK